LRRPKYTVSLSFFRNRNEKRGFSDETRAVSFLVRILMVPLARKNIYWDCRAQGFYFPWARYCFHKYQLSAKEIVLQTRENENTLRNENVAFPAKCRLAGKMSQAISSGTEDSKTNSQMCQAFFLLLHFPLIIKIVHRTHERDTFYSLYTFGIFATYFHAW